MEILNTFIEQASNIWWGIIAAIVVVVSLYFIIYALFSGSKQFSPLSYVVAIPLLPMLAFQFYLLIGAASVKHKCSEIAAWVDVTVPRQSLDGTFSQEDIRAAFCQLTATFPIAAQFIDINTLAESRDSSLGQTLTHKTNSYLNWFIVRRVAWSFGFIVVAVFGIVFTMQKYFKRSSSNLKYHSSIDDF